jgi:hypothetical protein
VEESDWTPEEIAQAMEQIEAMEAQKLHERRVAGAQLDIYGQRATQGIAPMLNQQFPQTPRNPMAEQVAQRAMFGVEDMLNAPSQGTPASLLPPQAPVVDPLRLAPSAQVQPPARHSPSMGDYLGAAGKDFEYLANAIYPAREAPYKGIDGRVGALSPDNRRPQSVSAPQDGDRKPHPERPEVTMVRRGGLWHPEESGRGPQSVEGARLYAPDRDEPMEDGFTGGPGRSGGYQSANPSGGGGGRRANHDPKYAKRGKKSTARENDIVDGDYYYAQNYKTGKDEKIVRIDGRWVVVEEDGRQVKK